MWQVMRLRRLWGRAALRPNGPLAPGRETDSERWTYVGVARDLLIPQEVYGARVCWPCLSGGRWGGKG